MYTLKENPYYNDNDMVVALNKYSAVALKTNPNMTIEVSLRHFVWIKKKRRKI
jgi:hypothetical protein